MSRFRALRSLVVLAGLAAGLTATAAPGAAVPAGPGPVEGALVGVTQIAAGDSHSCARLNHGQARCWGANDDGEVGDGTQTERLLPTTVKGPSGVLPLLGVAQIDAGSYHSCARLSGGVVHCWGGNYTGELGDGTTANRPLAALVTVPGGGSLTGVAQIDASDGFTCARLVDGRVRCWGDNSGGELGNGSTTERHRAVLVTVPGGGPLTGVTQISAGRDHACARLATREVRCWGRNDNGELGDGTTQTRLRARVVRNGAGTGRLVGVRSVTAGDGFTCALLRTGQVRCWGENIYGTLGDGTFTDHPLPAPVLSPSGVGRLMSVTRLNAGQGFTCAITQGGTSYCWGRNVDGAIGDGTDTDRPLPTTVLDPTGTIFLSNVAQFSGGAVHTCARLTTGGARCWGGNSYGAVGDGTTVDRYLPTVVQL